MHRVDFKNNLYGWFQILVLRQRFLFGQSTGEQRKIHLPFLKFQLTIFKMVKTAHLPKWIFWTM